jgi:NTE family protein
LDEVVVADAPARDAFASVPGLAELTEEDRLRFEEEAARLRVRRGTVLVRQGDPTNELYIVLAGRFFVTLDNRPGVIAEIGPGEPIGELAFFGNVSRTASVTAARDSEVLLLTREAYAKIVQRAPAIQTRILTSLAMRLAAVTAASPTLKARPARTVALLPIGESPKLPTGFLERLTRALSPRSVVVVSGDTIRAELPACGVAGIGEFVAGVERSADIVLFVLEHETDEPAQLCLSYADDLLLVAPQADAEAADTTPSRIEEEAARFFIPEHLSMVICRERAAQPISNTERWLGGRDVALHHHLALDNQADFDRLARFLTGTATGLVLGGGGVMGCAHIGVAKALKEAGIAVDFIGGTSVGAGVATALAAGFDPDAILDRTEEMFVRNRTMRRVTVPIYSLLDHRAFDASLRRHYGDLRMEDLPFNCFAVSANLTSRRIHIHRTGPLWEAVRASTAIPGILPPFIKQEGDVLVDGALVDNVPIDVMRKLKLGPNIVVLFKHAGDWRFTKGYAELPSRGALLRHLILGRRTMDYPSLVSIVLRGMFLTSESIQRMSAPGDLFVSPTVPADIRLLDWRRSREIAMAAYRQMKEILEERESVMPKDVG